MNKKLRVALVATYITLSVLALSELAIFLMATAAGQVLLVEPLIALFFIPPVLSPILGITLAILTHKKD